MGEETKMKKTIKTLALLAIGLILLVSTIAGALAQEDLELPEAGITPLKSKALWKAELFFENVKDTYYFAMKNYEKMNNYRIQRAEERLSEYAVVVLQDEALAEEVMAENTRQERKILSLKETEANVQKHIQVLERVRERLRLRGIEPEGLDIALENSEKIMERIRTRLPKISTSSVKKIELLEAGD